MNPIDIPAIEAQARRLRAAEIQRINGLFAERARLVAKLAVQSVAAGAVAVSEALRPMFSWSPRPGTKSSAISIEPLLDRMNHAARTLFSWNPQVR